MADFWRNVVVLGCLEPTPGTYKEPAVTDAILIGKDFSINRDIPDVERDVMRGFIGGKETVPGVGPTTLQFKIELAGSGAAATAPPWGMLLKLAGFSAALTAGVKWDYTPISNNFPSGSFAFYFGGTRVRMRAARVAEIAFQLNVNGIPEAAITVIGIEHQTMDEIAAPTPNLSAWKEPIVIKAENSATISWGGVYNPATGEITGGTEYPSDGLRISIKNNARYRPFLGGDSVPITAREVTGSIRLDLNGAARAFSYNAYKTNMLNALGFRIGNEPGKRFAIYMPACERNNPGHDNDDGLIVDTFDIRARSVLGNDEIRLIAM